MTILSEALNKHQWSGSSGFEDGEGEASCLWRRWKCFCCCKNSAVTMKGLFRQCWMPARTALEQGFMVSGVLVTPVLGYKDRGTTKLIL